MKRTGTLLALGILLAATTRAGTAYLGNNAVLSQSTRATVTANGDNHAIATADPNAASAVLDWERFNVGPGQQMTFDGRGTTFFNLVDGAAGKSQIDGIIDGTAGNVWVINPAGVAFSSTAQVDIGGLFAAAAGNISNADALRDGPALLPEFSSLEGKVEVEGSTFDADQVALLGKSVSVDGGTFKGDVNVAAASAAQVQIVVDDVGGGKVKLNLSDFAYDSSVNTIELGDLEVAGDVTTRSGGNTTLGNVRTSSGSIDVEAMNGDVIVARDVAVADGKLVLKAAGSIKGTGRIETDADHVAEFTSYIGDVKIENAENSIDGPVTAQGSNVKIVNKGNLRRGDVTATRGDVDVKSTDGFLILMDGAEITTRSGDVTMNAAKSAYVLGSVNAPSGKFSVRARDGMISLGETGGTIKVADVDLKAAENVKVVVVQDENSPKLAGLVCSGGIRAEGTEVTIAANSDLNLDRVVANDGLVRVGSRGAITIPEDAVVSARSESGKEASVDIRAEIVGEGRGDITILGQVEASDDVKLMTYNGQLTIDQKAEVISDNGTVMLGSVGVGADMVVDGNVVAAGDVTVQSGALDASSGSLKIGGTISSGAIIDVWSGETGGDITITGVLDAYGKGAMVNIATGFAKGARGNIHINGKIDATDPTDANSVVTIITGVSDGSSGDIDFGVNASVSADKVIYIGSREGNVYHGNGEIEVSGGRVDPVMLSPILKSELVQFNVNGNVGRSDYDYLSVDGLVYGYASGNAAIAAADGKDFQGGVNTRLIGERKCPIQRLLLTRTSQYIRQGNCFQADCYMPITI